MVAFVNEDPQGDPRTPEGKLTQIPIRNSVALRQMMTDPRVEDASMALMLFRIVFVNVADVSEAECPAANRTKCPFTVVVDADGKPSKPIGPGVCTKAQLLEALKAAVQPRLDLGAYLEKKRALVKHVVKEDALKAELASKTSTRGSKLEEELARSEAETSAMEKDIADMLRKLALKPDQGAGETGR